MGIFVRYRLVEETDSTATYELSDSEEGPAVGRVTIDKVTRAITDPEETVTHAMFVTVAQVVRRHKEVGKWTKGGAVQS